MSGGASRELPEWAAALSVREVPEVENELRSRYLQSRGQRAVGVTDLLALRPAYYRRVGPPAPIPPDRQQRLDQGRALHRELGARLANEGTLEARVRREGLVGRIDLLSDVPVEVKTSGSLVPAETLLQARPEHLEQLAMYCALTGLSAGRLLTLAVDSGRVTAVQAVQCRFHDTDRLLLRMQQRAQGLREAVSQRSPDRLPRCPWFGRGCEFRAASACSCSGEEPMDSPPLSDALEQWDERPDLSERVRSLFPEPLPTDVVMVGRFRELMYPRRTYFERTQPRATEPEAPPSPAEAPDLYARLTEAVESGPAGEVGRLVSHSREPEEEVVGFRGNPFLVKTSRAGSRLRPAELARRAPQYAEELGLRCAVTGASFGLVVMGYERAEDVRDRFQVLGVTFETLTPFSRLFRERRSALATAIERRVPDPLPSCPEWMTRDCPYRTVCGCESVPKVTR